MCVYTLIHTVHKHFKSSRFLVHCQSTTVTVIHRHSHANTTGLIQIRDLAELLSKSFKKWELFLMEIKQNPLLI